MWCGVHAAVSLGCRKRCAGAHSALLYKGRHLSPGVPMDNCWVTCMLKCHTEMKPSGGINDNGLAKVSTSLVRKASTEVLFIINRKGWARVTASMLRCELHSGRRQLLLRQLCKGFNLGRLTPVSVSLIFEHGLHWNMHTIIYNVNSPWNYLCP